MLILDKSRKKVIKTITGKRQTRYAVWNDEIPANTPTGHYFYAWLTVGQYREVIARQKAANALDKPA